MRAQLRRRKRRKRARRHRRAEVRAADPDIDDIGENIPSRAKDRALAQRAGERRDLGALGLHRRHDVLAVDADWGVGKIAQGHVQSRAAFGEVDLVARKQGLAPFFEPGSAGEIEQMAESRPSEAVLRIVVQQVVEADGKMLEPAGIVGEEIQRAPWRRSRRDGLPGRRKRRRGPYPDAPYPDRWCDSCPEPESRFLWPKSSLRGRKTTAFWRVAAMPLAGWRIFRLKGAWLLPFLPFRASA